MRYVACWPGALSIGGSTVEAITPPTGMFVPYGYSRAISLYAYCGVVSSLDDLW